jgi:heme/copper-type cytochrome/quinol oxidase subunit 2
MFPRVTLWLIPMGLMVVVGVLLSVRRITQHRLTDSLKELDAEVLGDEYRLYFRYPGEDGVLHTQDDRFGLRDFYVPANSAVRLRLSSLDYIYLVEVPEVGVYEIAAPDLVFDVRFVAPQGGKHELLGSQMCGYDHPELLGKLIVQAPAEFVQTMKRLSRVPLQSARQ